MVNGRRFYVKEFPMDPFVMDRAFASPFSKTYLWEGERVYVKKNNYLI